MIVEKLISDVSDALRNDKCKFTFAFLQCKNIGFLRKEELMKFLNQGFPVIQIYSNVMRIPLAETQKKIIEGCITYDELLCILAIFAQDIMVNYQTKRR